MLLRKELAGHAANGPPLPWLQPDGGYLLPGGNIGPTDSRFTHSGDHGGANLQPPLDKVPVGGRRKRRLFAPALHRLQPCHGSGLLARPRVFDLRRCVQPGELAGVEGEFVEPLVENGPQSFPAAFS